MAGKRLERVSVEKRMLIRWNGSWKLPLIGGKLEIKTDLNVSLAVQKRFKAWGRWILFVVVGFLGIIGIHYGMDEVFF